MTADNRDPKTSKSDLSQKLPRMSLPAERPAREEEMAAAILSVVANEYCYGTVFAVDGGFQGSQP